MLCLIFENFEIWRFYRQLSEKKLGARRFCSRHARELFYSSFWSANWGGLGEEKNSEELLPVQFFKPEVENIIHFHRFLVFKTNLNCKKKLTKFNQPLLNIPQSFPPIDHKLHQAFIEKITVLFNRIYCSCFLTRNEPEVIFKIFFLPPNRLKLLIKMSYQTAL